MAKLVAKSHIKFGSKVVEVDGQGRPSRTIPGTRVAPGETFEADTDMAKRFLENGTAITAAEARAEERERMSAEERLREAEEEAREAGLDVSITTGAEDRSLAAHREQQEDEEAAVEEAQRSAAKPKGKGR